MVSLRFEKLLELQRFSRGFDRRSRWRFHPPFCADANLSHNASTVARAISTRRRSRSGGGFGAASGEWDDEARERGRRGAGRRREQPTFPPGALHQSRTLV